MTLLLLLLQSLTPVPAPASIVAEKILKVVESHHISVAESSGLCWAKGENGKRALVAVSDKDHALYFFESKAGGAPTLTQKVEVAIPGGGPQSQWESVYADQSGRVFILPESPSVVHVYDLKSAKLFATLNLELNADWKKKLEWDAADNSQGEGLLLLKNGHILVLKEKEPLKIVEFAPEGKAKAEGFRPELSLEKNGEFPVSSTKTKFVPVHFWSLAESQKSIFPDGSGLNVGQKDELYILSDQGLAIGKLGTLDPSKNSFQAAAIFRLPEEVQKPEGMVFDSSGRILVASDAALKLKKKKKAKDPKPNFFVLSMD